MTRPFVIGLDAKLYRGVTVDADEGDPFNPAIWEELENAQDVSLSIAPETTDASSRASGGWRQAVSTLKSATLDFSLLWVPDDPLLVKIVDKEMFEACAWPYMVVDHHEDKCGYVGADYWMFVANFVLAGFDWNQALTDPLTADISLELGPGRVPVFTALNYPTVAGGTGPD